MTTLDSQGNYSYASRGGHRPGTGLDGGQGVVSQ